jgi:hypothetical protein
MSRRPWAVEVAIYFVLGLFVGWVFLKAVGCGMPAAIERCSPPAVRCLTHESDGYADRLEVCLADYRWHFSQSCPAGTICYMDSGCVFP